MLLVTSCSQEPDVFKEYETVFKLGDRPEWATQNWNVNGWKKERPILDDGRVFWSRTKIDVLKAPKPLQPYGIQLEVYGEYEVFWDGVLIGKNGNPGQELNLGPEGILWATFSIPTHLTEKGVHVLALRSSLYYFSDHAGIHFLEIDNYENLLTNRLIESSYMHVFAGAFLIAAIYFLFLFLGNKKEYPKLVFSISCLLFFWFNNDPFCAHHFTHTLQPTCDTFGGYYEPDVRYFIFNPTLFLYTVSLPKTETLFGDLYRRSFVYILY